MVQVIPAGNKWSMAGSNFGQGISEQIPKEVEHYRLSQGLKNLGQQKNLTPMEYATQAASIYGMTPEMQRQFGQLAREQGNRNAYLNLANQGQQQSTEPRGFDSEEFRRPPVGTASKSLRNIQSGIAESGIQKTENERAINPREENKSAIVNRNPTAREQEHVPDWSPERVIQEKANITRQFPQLLPEQIDQLAKENEARYKSLSETDRKNYDRQEEIRDAVERKFDKSLRNRLETPEGTPIYEDISGVNYENVKRELEKDIRDNPNIPIDEQVAKWTQNMVNFADTKQELKQLANRGLFDRWFSGKETLNSLKSYQKAFSKTGNLKEFNDILRKRSDEGGFDMSNGGADQIAYPRSKEVEKYVDNFPRIKMGDAEKDSRNFAKNLVEKGLLKTESPLAIARDARDKDPFFNINEFLNYFRDHQDDIPLMPHQLQDVQGGQGGAGGYWGDYFVLPNKRNEK